MNSFKMKLSKRIMAICLATTIILGSAFNHVGQVFANTEGGGSESLWHTITVVDSVDAAKFVENATVTYSVYKNVTDDGAGNITFEEEVIVNATTTTDENGVCAINNYETELSDNSNVLYVKVEGISAYGYESYANDGNTYYTITDSSEENIATVQLTELEKFAYSGTVSLQGSSGATVISDVSIVASYGNNQETATADENGQFSIALYEGIEYDIVFSHKDYISVTVDNVQLDADTNGNDVEMAEKAASEGYVFNYTSTEDLTKEYIGEEITFTNVVYKDEAVVSDRTISYEIISETKGGFDADVAEINTETGQLTINSLGTVEVKATIAYNDTHKETTLNYTLNIVKGEDPGFKFTTGSASIKYGNDFENFASSTNSNNGTITYEIISEKKGVNPVVNAGEVAEINTTTGQLTINGVGEIVVEATISESDVYAETKATYTLTINQADSPSISFSKGENYTVVFDEYDADDINEATCNEISTGILSYEIIDEATNGDVADINSTTGELTIKSIGTVVVEATIVDNDGNYADAVGRYTLVVTAAEDDTFKFENEPDVGDTAINVIYGDNNNEYTNIANSTLNTLGTVTYAIISGNNYASINETTGKLTIASVGTVVVTATITAGGNYNGATATYTLNISKGTDTTVAFENCIADGSTNFEFDTNNNKYENAVTSENISSENMSVTYTIESAKDINEYDVIDTTTIAKFEDSSSAVLSIINTGTVVVKATIVDNDGNYNDVVARYTLTITKGTDNTFEFENKPEENETSIKVIYGENDNQYTNAANSEKDLENRTITYEIKSGDDVAKFANDADKAAGILTILKIGTVEVEATITENGKYKANTATYTLTIEQAEDDSFGFENGNSVSITYNAEDKTYTNIAKSTKNSTASITYSIKSIYIEGDDDVSGFSVDSNKGVVTYNKAAVITVQATISGGNYKDKTIEYTLTVNKADRTISMGDIETEVTYNDNGNVIDLYVKDYVGTGNVTYYADNLDNNNPVAVVNGDKLEIKKAGTVEVYAKIDADDCYNSAQTEPIEITINQYSQLLEFDNNNISLVYGEQKTYTNTATVKSNFSNNKGITYSIDDDTNSIISSINKTTGEIVFNDCKVGTVVIKATKGKDNNYFSTSATYVLTVSYMETTGTTYEISGPKNDNWYTGDVTITATDGYYISYTNSFEDANWSKTVTYTQDGKASADIYVRKIDENGNLKGISSIIPTTEIWKDSAKPTNITVSYNNHVIKGVLETLTFGFYKSSVKVVFKSEDDVSGISKIAYEFVDEDGTVIENSLVTKELESDLGTDSYEFELTVSPQFRNRIRFYVYDVAGNCAQADDKYVLVVDDIAPNITAKYDVENAKTVLDSKYIYSNDTIVIINIEESNYYEEDVAFRVTKNGNEYEFDTPTYLNDGDIHSYTFSFKEDGDYIVYVDYEDRSGNETNVNTKIVTVDKTAPDVSFSFETIDIDADNNMYYQSRSGVIEIKELNFDPSKVEISVVAEENEEPYTYSELSNKENWTETSKGVWETTIDFEANKTYTSVYVSCKDQANWLDEASNDEEFVVDNTAPTNLAISYSDPVSTIISTLTFGFYKTDVTLTFTGNDNLAGIDKISWAYAKNSDASANSNHPVSHENLVVAGHIDGTWTASVTLDVDTYKQLRGNFSIYATDKAGNKSEIYTDDGNTIILDNISPTCVVTYTKENQAVGNTLYYDGDVTLTFAVTEANFYAEDVVIKVNGTEKKVTNWTKNGDVTTGTLKLSGNGTYNVAMTHKDHSGNELSKSVDKTFIIDSTYPVINVAYSNKDIKNTIDGYNYFAANQTATITIVEENFRSSDVKFNVTAKNYIGEAINANTTLSAWTKSGNNNTATVTFSQDAFYDISIEYTDLSLRKAAPYSGKIVVDKTNPQNLNISYSRSVNETIINALTFGYYNSKAIVTITTNDTTAGIDKLVYSYIKDAGVSNINAEMIDVTISGNDLIRDGNSVTGTFEIPQQVLAANSQFNGTVKVVAYDFAGNTVELHDSKKIIVDNISPQANVTYNTPAKQANDILYYAGNIDIAININEANFDANDVVIAVNKDGVTYNVNTIWTDNSVDSHTGTFTLTEDGDYTFTVNYTDKSTNVMERYESQQFTLDTKIPTVTVSNIVANSANKDETYTFTITASDINFDVDAFKPKLKGIVKNADGKYDATEIEIVDMNVVEDGKTYSFVIENIDLDGIYTLSCFITDMSGNEYSKILLDDGKEYDEVEFSINRDGSTYKRNESTDNIVNQYYVYEVGEDIVIEEINVDQVDKFIVKLNGEELVEGTDYTTKVVEKESEAEWSKRIYTIKKENFDEEGVYNISVESTDKANNTSYSDVKEMQVEFVVDKTAPTLTISGLEDEGRYQVEEQTVTVIPADDGGKVYSFKAVILNSDGSEGSVRFNMSGEELATYLAENGGKITFTIPEGMSQNVKVICTDSAFHGENGKGNEYTYTFERVTVSQSGFVMFFANQDLIRGIIISAVTVVAGIIILIVARKKKKKEVK